MVDRYYRKINDVRNDIENSIQISGILLKLSEYDDELGDLSKIGNNENNISSNLGKIDTNKNNVLSNFGKTDTNKTNISSNLGKITTNEGAISSNLGKIDDIKESLIYFEDFKKLLILKNKYLDLIKPHIFILFLKKRLHMISLKIVYYS